MLKNKVNLFLILVIKHWNPGQILEGGAQGNVWDNKNAISFYAFGLYLQFVVF